MTQRTQNFSNHARTVPLYHFGLGGLAVVNLFQAVRVAMRGLDEAAVFGLVQAVALALVTWYARAFALAAQDRVIRLEMRLRLERLLPPALLARAAALTPIQLIALRFAGDAEMAELVEQVLEGRLAAPADIKKSVRDWQADWMRV